MFNLADPLHLKGMVVNNVPGMKSLQETVDHNALGRFLTNGPSQYFMPREYQVSSPWAGIQVDEDKANEANALQRQNAWAALANDQGGI